MLMIVLAHMQLLLVSVNFLLVIKVSCADYLTALTQTLLVWQEVLKGNTSLLKGNTSLLKGNASVLTGNTSLLKGNTSLLSKAAESQPLQVTFLEQQVGCLLLLTHSCGQQHVICMPWVHVRLRCCAFSIACVIACITVCVIACVMVCVIACVIACETWHRTRLTLFCAWGLLGFSHGSDRPHCMLPRSLIFMCTTLPITYWQQQAMCKQIVSQQQGSRHVQAIGYHLAPIKYHLPPI